MQAVIKGSVAKTYNTQELPYILLEDCNGISVAKNLHGKDPDSAIAKFLRK
jgi:hypothetical protein